LLSPALFPRANTISSTFESYRFTHVTLRMLPLDVASGGQGGSFWVMGFCDDVSATNAIASVQELSECTPSGCQGVSMSLTTNTSAYYPTSTIVLNSKTLISNGSLKWWKVTGDSGTNSWENFQAMLLFYNQFAATVIFEMWVHYTVEFISPINQLLTKRHLISGAAHLLPSTRVSGSESGTSNQNSSSPEDRKECSSTRKKAPSHSGDESEYYTDDESSGQFNVGHGTAETQLPRSDESLRLVPRISLSEDEIQLVLRSRRK